MLLLNKACDILEGSGRYQVAFTGCAEVKHGKRWSVRAKSWIGKNA
jgi:hypothetical protein